MYDEEANQPLRLSVSVSVVYGATLSDKTVNRMLKLKRAISSLEMEDVLDDCLANDMLDVMETVVNISRRSKAAKRRL